MAAVPGGVVGVDAENRVRLPDGTVVEPDEWWRAGNGLLDPWSGWLWSRSTGSLRKLSEDELSRVDVDDAVGVLARTEEGVVWTASDGGVVRLGLSWVRRSGTAGVGQVAGMGPVGGPQVSGAAAGGVRKWVTALAVRVGAIRRKAYLVGRIERLGLEDGVEAVGFLSRKPDESSLAGGMRLYRVSLPRGVAMSVDEAEAAGVYADDVAAAPAPATGRVLLVPNDLAPGCADLRGV